LLSPFGGIQFGEMRYNRFLDLVGNSLGNNMAEMTIRLRVNPETGRKDIVINLRSDEDALPQEHERHHRQLVDKLIQRGVLAAGEAGDLVVEREEETAIPDAPVSSPEPQRQSEQEGN
jgi:hypothetical protein